ncbi:MAG: DDE-type integrase/transposase/recombinase [Pseudomonadaceae bacterium]|nr:DDE-type integrase/transposase/recombinase [Pseudomonadaceae bacterium]
MTLWQPIEMKNIYKRHRLPPSVFHYTQSSNMRFGSTTASISVFVKSRGKQHYLWRAVDQDGGFVDVYLQERRDTQATKRFFQRFLKSGGTPREIITDKLGSYGVAHGELTPETRHNTDQCGNNRAELSHQPTRVRERVMRRFKSIKQVQLSVSPGG